MIIRMRAKKCKLQQNEARVCFAHLLLFYLDCSFSKKGHVFHSNNLQVSNG